MPTIPQIDIKQYFCTNMVIPKELLAKNLVYLGMVCNVSLKKFEKTAQVWTKRSSRPKNDLQQTISTLKSCP